MLPLEHTSDTLFSAYTFIQTPIHPAIYICTHSYTHRSKYNVHIQATGNQIHTPTTHAHTYQPGCVPSLPVSSHTHMSAWMCALISVLTHILAYTCALIISVITLHIHISIYMCALIIKALPHMSVCICTPIIGILDSILEASHLDLHEEGIRLIN